MESMLLRIKVAAQSLRTADELVNSLPEKFVAYDAAQAGYISAELGKVKSELGKGPYQSALKSAISKVQKMLEERR